MFVIKDIMSGKYLITSNANTADPKNIELAKRYENEKGAEKARKYHQDRADKNVASGKKLYELYVRDGDQSNADCVKNWKDREQEWKVVEVQSITVEVRTV